MRKFLSSPLTRKRSPMNHTNAKVFGTPLEILIQKNSSEVPVPYIITRICQYIEKSGLSQEGLFRISGNARLIERLKSSFDQSGDAPLETEGDVASAAALLKLFLRELPEPLIPSSMHQAFLSTAKINGQSKEECINQLKNLVQRLPLVNLNVLKYLSYFLVSVSHHEEENRMNASALGIVFGPNLFRVAEDFKGLKEQSLTNQIVTYFISDYHSIFDGDIEYTSTRVDTIGGEERLISLNNNACLGLPSSTLATQKASLYPSISSASELESLSVVIPSVDNALLMIHSDKESLPEKPSPFLMVNSLVEETINRTITEHLFGDDKNSIGEETNGTSAQFRRKRKDRKFPEKDHVHDTVDRGIHSVETTMRADPLTVMTHMDDVNGFHSLEKCENKQQSVKHYNTDEIHNVSIDTLTHESRIQSPRPPKPKRREVELLATSEPILDPHAVSSSGDFGFHEAQRSMERLTPVENRQTFLRKSQSAYPGLLPGSPGLQSVMLSSITECKRVVKRTTAKKKRSPTRSQLLISKSIYQKGSPLMTDRHEDSCGNNESEPLMEDYETILHNPVNPSYISSNDKNDDNILEENIGSSQTENEDVFNMETSIISMEGSFIKISPSDLPSDNLDLPNTSEDKVFLRSVKDVDNISDIDEKKFTHRTNDSIASECSASNINDFDNIEPSSFEHRFSWPILKSIPCEDATLSPCPNHLRKTNSFEASLSPSAYKSYLSHRSEHFDPSLPPSPPVEQEDFIKSSCKDDETVALSIKFLTKKIHGLKKKIKQFDEAYETMNGYRPSHAEKMNYPDMKKIITELNKTRKELKYLKDDGDVMEVSVESPVPHLPEPCVCSEFPNTKSTTTVKVAENHGVIIRDGRKRHTVEESLKETLKNLSDKRHVAERPEDLEAMTKEQVIEEKIAIQKALLRFESVHGRPTSKTDRDLMRPLYDRYRNVKRIITKSGYQSSSTSKVKDSLAELQPILEHVAMDFKTPEHRRENEQVSSLPVTESSHSLSVADRPDDFPQLDKETDNQSENNIKLKNIPHEAKYSSNLHELPLPELIRQQQYAKIEKHRLRRVLRDFEEQFQKQTGRKLQKEDRIPMETVYAEYKHVKAQLKLLEALLSKHEQHLI